MTARKIEARRNQKLGTVRQGAKGKPREINTLCVYPDAAGKGPMVPIVEVQIPSDSVPGGTTRYYMFLRPNAALEIVKGLLQNLPPMYICADDELIAIFRGIEGDVVRETAALGRLLDERRGPITTPDNPNLPTPLDVELEEEAREIKRERAKEEGKARRAPASAAPSGEGSAAGSGEE